MLYAYAGYAAAVWLFLIGLYGVVTSTHLIHLCLSLTVVQASTYVLLTVIGYRPGLPAPIFTDGVIEHHTPGIRRPNQRSRPSPPSPLNCMARIDLHLEPRAGCSWQSISRRIAMAAFLPLMPITLPPGWVQAPHK
jgi:hypothetical protein